jgi:hypothetical protein
MRPEELAAHLIGAMTQWGDGYTDPNAEGEQYRVRWAGTDDDGAELFTVTPGRRRVSVPGETQTFRVLATVVLVEEVKP